MNTLASFTATDTLWMLVCACFVFLCRPDSPATKPVLYKVKM